MTQIGSNQVDLEKAGGLVVHLLDGSNKHKEVREKGARREGSAHRVS